MPVSDKFLSAYVFVGCKITLKFSFWIHISTFSQQIWVLIVINVGNLSLVSIHDIEAIQRQVEPQIVG
jgi:hypothetical protein